MSKKFLIIGGGISGCALLHYLIQKYRDQPGIDVVLLEKNDHLGGTIQSLTKDGCLFETGPNGFLDSKPRTLEFVKELKLQDSLVQANQESSMRYISVGKTLHQLPTGPKGFLSFKLLSLPDKLRVLGEFFIPKKNNPDESVYDFGKRRLGVKFSEMVLDPMVSGIYAGDARNLNLKAVFPRMFQLEEQHGSLFKAMVRIRKERKSQNTNGSPLGTLTSFRGGVAQLIDAVGNKYQENIRLNSEVSSIEQGQDRFQVLMNNGECITADEIYICAPAHSIGSMLNGVNHRLSQALGEIHYAPVAVVGLVYPREYFAQKPKGFGYLIPSSEQNEILGVLFEGNIFEGRCRDDQIFFRVMIGGARHPDILNKAKEELIEMASREIEIIFKNNHGPQEKFFVTWAKAIPQYDQSYCELIKTVNEELDRNKKLHLVANYIKGISMNDCIENAYQAAQNSNIFA